MTRALQIREGNVLDVTSGIIIQQVNAQGVMGSGVAKAIRDKWPVVWDEYNRVVGPAYTQKDSGRHLLGTMIPVKVAHNLWVCNIVGQQFFGGDPKGQPNHRYTSYDALADGMRKVCLFGYTEEAQIIDDRWYADKPPLHFPLIGCDRGGGAWEIVQAIINWTAHKYEKTLWLLPGTNPSILRS